MRRKALALLPLIALFLVGAPASGSTQRVPVSGDFSLMHMVHTRAFIDRQQQTQEPNPWDGSSEGKYRYASIPCSENAPVNNVSTNLTTYNSRLPGSLSPASARNHPLEFDAENGKLRGNIVLTVCQLEPGATDDDPESDAEKPKIFFDWTADYTESSDKETTWSGTFKITGGTGTYEGLTGSGKISGYFFCFGGCADGTLTDGQYTMTGKFRDIVQ